MLVGSIKNALSTRSPLDLLQLSGKVTPMFLRGLWWNLWFENSKGVALIGRHVTIHNPQYISVGQGFVAEDYSEIQGLSSEGIVFGDHVTVGRFAMIRPSGYYGREIGVGLKIGDYSNIGQYCFIGCSGRITIGRDVLMGPRVSLIAENHNFDNLKIPIREQGVSRKPIVIEDNCWIGNGSTILAGVHINDGAVIAAGAVVVDEVPSNAIVGGIPARIIGWRTQE